MRKRGGGDGATFLGFHAAGERVAGTEPFADGHCVDVVGVQDRRQIREPAQDLPVECDQRYAQVARDRDELAIIGRTTGSWHSR